MVAANDNLYTLDFYHVGSLMDLPLEIGERVRVVQGPLRGVEGNVLEFQGKLYVVVGLAGMIYARARVPRAWLEKVDGK